MYLYFDSQGTLKEQINDEALRQGNSGINQLYIYWERGSLNDSLFYRFKASSMAEVPSGTTYYTEHTVEYGEIPFSKKRDLKFFKYFTEYQFYVINIPDVVLGSGGAWLGSIWINKGGNITTLSRIAFFVEESNATVEADENINIAQWNSLMISLGDVENGVENLTQRVADIEETTVDLQPITTTEITTLFN